MSVLKDDSERIVNIISLSCKLADASMRDEIGDEYEVDTEDGNGNVIYTVEAQEIFDRWYDYYFGVIEAEGWR